MELSQARALKLLMGGPATVRELAKKMRLSYSRVAAIVHELTQQGYCERRGGRVILTQTANGELLKKLSYRYDLISLLGGASESVLLSISKPSGTADIQRTTGHAQSTVYQALRNLTTIGAVRRQGKNHVLADDPDLKTFTELLRRELEAKEIEPYALLVHSDGSKLKKVQAGRPARGSKTAFSMFGKLGIDYPSPSDYYVEPEREVSMEEILIHAMKFSERKTDVALCTVFYMKNINRIDTAKAKALAKEFGVLSLWIDMQNYVRGAPVHDTGSFLPWEEFSEKAAVYGVRAHPVPSSASMMAALEKIGGKLGSDVHAYLFGGANMLMRGLKNATKDFDIVVGNRGDFLKLRVAILTSGFRPLGGKEITPSDKRLDPSGIYVAEGMPRFDIFTGRICKALFLTRKMKENAEPRRFGKLVLHMLSLEDVLLLKSITEREGDLEDMAVIVRMGGALDWKKILDTYFLEEAKTKTHFCFTILDNIEILQQREGIAVPIRAELLRHCIGTGILQSLSYGASDINRIRSMIDFPEHTIRNGVEKLVKERMILKKKKGKRIILALTKLGRASLFQK